MTSSHTRVAILVDTSSGWGRRVIRGVANYALKCGNWNLIIEERGMNEAMNLEATREVDGIIGRVSDQRIYKELMATGKPIVNVSGILVNGVDLPRVAGDYDATGEIAAQHFAERGFHNLAYCGLEYKPYEQRHCQAFVDAAEQKGLSCSVFDAKRKRTRNSQKSEREALCSWLQGLTKPVGVLTWGNRRARTLLNLCSQLGISVPEQIAVLSGDDDDLLCEVCRPPLSAIVTPAEQMGYESARILDAILDGEPAPKDPILIPPTCINTRLSTDTLAISDPELGLAIQFIRDNLHRPMQVSEVAVAARLSRRTLERRFVATLGHSPAKEIQATRLKRAQKLLRETNMSVADVATASGYSSMEYLIKVIQKATGQTPLKYRTWIKAK